VVLLHGGEAHVHPEELPGHLAWWHWDFPVLLGLGVAALGYAFVAWWLWRRAGRFDRRAAAAWALGLLVVFVTLESPLDAVAEKHLVSAHMLQHGLLISVAPPLLLLGLYPRLVVPFSRPILKPLLRNRRTHAALRVLSAPALVLGLWLTILYAWHLPALYQSALRNETVHVAQHLFFVNAGLLFWLPVIEPVPVPSRMKPLAKLGYLAAGQVGTALLAAALIWGPELYPFYDSLDTLWGLSREADQRLAGLVMMVVDMLVALTVAGWIVSKWLVEAERRGRRLSPAVE
jgi:cytochrome c oxidase assembly factor CtaG